MPPPEVTLPPLQPLFDFPVRDTSVCLAPDGFYYLTGTTGHPTWWTNNEGIRIWRSPDLKAWEPLGLVWSFAAHGTWQSQRDPTGGIALWAPEIHFLKGTFYLTFSLAWNHPGQPSGRTGLLKSISGRAEGPYEDVATGPMTHDIDASLFQDDDGRVYWVWQNGMIARLNDEMTALVEEPRLLSPSNHHHVGFEGAFLTKIAGRYHLLCADFARPDGATTHPGEENGVAHDYHCYAASSDTLFGPYDPRYLAIPHGGHNMIFRDKAGDWWSTFFGNSGGAPFLERPAILRIEIDGDGRIRPLADVG